MQIAQALRVMVFDASAADLASAEREPVYEHGAPAVLVDGFPLGGGKVSGGRIKNHYPKGLRNLQ